MPIDGNGNYSLPPGTLVQEGETVMPSQHNPPFLDVGSTLSQVLYRSGVAPMTGVLNMNSNKIQNLAAPTNPNDALRLTDLSNRPAFLANKNNTNQTKDINSNLDKVTFTTEVFDEGGYYDAANSKWTPPAGRYHISAQAGVKIGTGYRTAFVLLYKNGTLHRKSPGNWSDIDNADLMDQINVPVEANGTDYFEIYVAVDAVAGTIIPGDIQRVWFSGHAI